METGKRCYVDRVGRNKWALNLFSKNNGARERTRRPGLRPRDDGSVSEGPEEGGRQCAQELPGFPRGFSELRVFALLL